MSPRGTIKCHVLTNGFFQISCFCLAGTLDSESRLTERINLYFYVVLLIDSDSVSHIVFTEK